MNKTNTVTQFSATRRFPSQPPCSARNPLVARGDFGTIKVQVRQSRMIGVDEPFELDATVIGIPETGEAEITFGPGGPAGYMYGKQRETSWVRLLDGKCEHSKHWICDEWLEKLCEIWERNQPVVAALELAARRKPSRKMQMVAQEKKELR